MKHITLLVCILAGIVWSDGIAQADVYPAYRIPDNSPLSIREVKRIPPFLHFDGEIEIEAEFVFNVFNDATNSYVEFTLSPIDASLTNLPFLIERGRNELPNEIIMFGEAEAAKLLLGDKMASDLYAGKYPSVSGKARIIIYNFGAGYECDKAVFVARFKKMVELKNKAEITEKKDKVTCK